MRCTIISKAGQVLAYGRLFIRQQTDGGLRLVLETGSGRVLEGGLLGEDGDMTEAGQVLAEQFFEVWGMSDLTLNIACAGQVGGGDFPPALPPSSGIEISLL